MGSLSCGKVRERARRHRPRQQWFPLFPSFPSLGRVLISILQVPFSHRHVRDRYMEVSMRKTAFLNSLALHIHMRNLCGLLTPPRGSSSLTTASSGSQKPVEPVQKACLGRRITRGRPQPAEPVKQGSVECPVGFQGSNPARAASRCKTLQDAETTTPLRRDRLHHFEVGNKKKLMKAALGSRTHWQRGACRTSGTGTGHPTRGLYLSVLSCEPFRNTRQAKPVARDGTGRRSYYRGRRLFASLHHSLVLIIAVPILPTQPVAAPHAAPPLCSHAESLSGKAE